MATLRELKTRIGSVSSSEKITGAMKMISSAKVRINEQALRKIQPFKDQIRSIMANLLATGVNFQSSLTEERPVEKIGIVVFGSDDGLCGAYNINVFKSLVSRLRKIRDVYGDGVKIDFYPVGRKMVKIINKFVETDENYSVKHFDGVDSKMSGNIVNRFTGFLKQEFIIGNLDRVEAVYMKFHSISRQRPAVNPVYPVDRSSVVEEGMRVSNVDKLYLFEPDPNSIFNQALPMYVLSMMQEITIENRASEQAARIMAMQSANDNAKKLLEELQLEYNKLRQQGITTELLDIIGGQVDR